MLLNFLQILIYINSESIEEYGYYAYILMIPWKYLSFLNPIHIFGMTVAAFSIKQVDNIFVDGKTVEVSSINLNIMALYIIGLIISIAIITLSIIFYRKVIKFKEVS